MSFVNLNVSRRIIIQSLSKRNAIYAEYNSAVGLCVRTTYVEIVYL